MESKDVRRDGGYSAEDEDDLSVIAALTKTAVLSFKAGKFGECVYVLNQLLLKREDDLQIIHNVAVAKYFQEGCSDPKKLLEEFNSIKKRSEEHNSISGEEVEVASNSGTKEVTGSKAIDLQVGSTMMLNIAVILFHLHEYEKACTILDALYQKIELIDRATALHICLLFLDVLLALPLDRWKYIDVSKYVEKTYCNVNGQINNGNSAHQSFNTITNSFSASINSTILDTSNDDSSAVTGNSSEDRLSRTLSEGKLNSLIWTIGMNGQNTMRSRNLLLSSDLLTDKHISTNDLKFKMQLYKVLFYQSIGKFKTAKCEMKIAMAMNMISDQDHALALILKSQLVSSLGNHQKSIKLLLMSISRTTETDTISSSIYNNNLGCLYYLLGKYHTSGIFFSRALKNHSFLRKEKPLKLSSFSQDKSLQMTYNCGLQYLACGKPFHAARCFHKASLIFHDKPLLWFRIAECCLMALEKGLLNVNKSEIKLHVVGKGKWRQISVEDDKGSSDFVKGSHTELSVLLAKQCLINALYLLDPHEQPITDYGRDCGAIMVEQAVRVNLSYVELELGNPLKALKTASSLLGMQDCSKMNMFLGNVYVAESLCLLNQPNEAAEQLLAYLHQMRKLEALYPESDYPTVKEVKTTNPQEACGILYADLAYILALQGDLEQADKFVTKALPLIPDKPEIILTAAYVDLMNGRMIDGLARLKECGHARFLPIELDKKGW